jgi:CHRD domain
MRSWALQRALRADRLLSDIKRSPQKFYFNVHSTPSFPGGAIRGQIRHLARN